MLFIFCVENCFGNCFDPQPMGRTDNYVSISDVTSTPLNCKATNGKTIIIIVPIPTLLHFHKMGNKFTIIIQITSDMITMAKCGILIIALYMLKLIVNLLKMTKDLIATQATSIEITCAKR